jgi:hypothetical protein
MTTYASDQRSLSSMATAYVSKQACNGAGRLDRISPAGVEWDAAVYPANADLILNKQALLAAYRVQAAPQPGPSETPPALQVAYTAAELNALSSLARQVACYEDQIERLKACNRLTNEQREQWRLKAQQAEAKLADSSQSVASADAKRHYNALKHRLAKMLHPDSVSGPTENRSAQEALFVEIWAAIDQIERPGRSSSVTRS